MSRFMSAKISIFALILAVLALGFVVSGPRQQTQKETANERVARTKTIRCGYILYPPYLEKDAKTGTLQGVAYDIFEQIAATLHKSVEWVEEIPVNGEIPSFEKGGIDAVCAITGGYDSNSYDRLSFSDYIFSIKNHIYARAGDDRFNGSLHLEDIDRSGARFIGLDGDTTMIYPQMLMPHARTITLPALAGTAQLFQEVKYGKADLLMVEAPVGEMAMKANPGDFKILDVQDSLPTYAMQIAVSKKDSALKETFDEAIRFMKLNGKFEPILRKYDPTGRILIKME
jgi:ABC-type amino acid transport substrate-binding protein